MSKRFGRNQKRKLRTLIQSQENVIEILSAKTRLAEMLTKKQNDLIADLEHTINTAKSIAGNYSALFDPKVFKMGFKTPVIRLPINNQNSWDAPSNCTMRFVNLPVLLSTVQRDYLTERVHVKVHFEHENICGYAIERKTLHDMGKDNAVELLSKQLAFQVYKELFE